MLTNEKSKVVMGYCYHCFNFQLSGMTFLCLPLFHHRKVLLTVTYPCTLHCTHDFLLPLLKRSDTDVEEKHEKNGKDKQMWDLFTSWNYFTVFHRPQNFFLITEQTQCGCCMSLSLTTELIYSLKTKPMHTKFCWLHCDFPTTQLMLPHIHSHINLWYLPAASRQSL